MNRVIRILAVIVLFVMATSRTLWNSIQTADASTKGSAQSGATTTSYAYDKNGRLTMVYSPSDQASLYSYDPAGNITSIRKVVSLELFSFSPQSGFATKPGTPGTQVTFTGIGFAAGVSSVSFNGTLATSVVVSPPNVVATVPTGATTGLVTITTAGGQVVTPVPFTVLVGS